MYETATDCLAALHSLLHRVDSKEFKTLSPPDVVDLGHKIWEISNTLQNLEEALKGHMRARVTQELGSCAGTVRYAGLQGSTCVVRVPKPRVKIRKGADLKGAQETLGKGFEKYFSTKHTPVRGFLDLASEADLDTMGLLQELVDISTDRPRVTYKPK